MRPITAHSLKPKKGKGDDLDDNANFMKALNELSQDKGGKGKGKPIDPKIQKKMLTFRKEFKRIKKGVGADSKDFRSDQTTRSLYRAMLSMMIELIPIAEKKYLESESESAIYSLNALLNQVKDLNSAIRTFDDLEGQAMHIVQRILAPSMMQIIQNSIVQSELLKSAIKGQKLSDKQVSRLSKKVDDSLKGQAAYMQELQKSVEERVKGYLLGDN